MDNDILKLTHSNGTSADAIVPFNVSIEVLNSAERKSIMTDYLITTNLTISFILDVSTFTKYVPELKASIENPN